MPWPRCSAAATTSANRAALNEALRQQAGTVAATQAALTVKEAAANTAQAQLNTAQAATQTVQAQVATASANVAKLQAALDDPALAAAQAKLTATTQAQTAAAATLANAQTDLAHADAAVVDAQSDVQAATQTVKTTTAAHQAAQTAQSQAAAAVKTAQAQLNAAQVAYHQAQTAVAKAQAVDNANQIVLPKGYAQALKDFMAGKLSAQQVQVIALAGNGNWDSVKVNKFVHNTADQATVIDNVFNMSVATRTELTKWTANLLNQIRRAMGTTPLVVSEGSVAYAQAVAAQYDADGFNNYAEPGHDTSALYKIGDQFNTFWEEDESINIVWNQMARNNLPGWQTVKTSVTLDAIKENIYKGLVGMLFNDLDSNWGHSESLTGLINAKLITGDHQQALGVSVATMVGSTLTSGRPRLRQDQCFRAKLLDLTVTGTRRRRN